MTQQIRALVAPAEDPGLVSSMLCGSSQPPITQVPVEQMTSSDLCRHLAYTVHIQYIHEGKITHTDKRKMNL